MSKQANEIQNLSPAKRALFEKMRARKESLKAPRESSIPRRNPDEPIPLALAQQRLRILHQLDPASAAYNIFKVIRMDTVDAAALETALGRIVDRHETLRTSFEVRHGEPHQVVGPKNRFRLGKVDLERLAPAARDGELRRRVREERRRPFDLRTGPVFRATLLRLSQRDHFLLINLHHIVADDWSVGVLARELATLYREGDSARLPELAIQYGDYASWQQKWFQGERQRKQLEYWKERLAAPGVLQLYSDKPRPPFQTFNGAKAAVKLGGAPHDALSRVTREENATPFMSLLAAYAALLQRYTRQDDIIIGVPIARRSHLSLEPLIGFFVNSLAIRLDLSQTPDFRTLIGNTRQVAMEAFEHRDLPMEKIIEAVQPRHDLPARQASKVDPMIALRYE